MRIEDKPAFTQLIAATMAVYEKQMTTSVVDIFFSALSPYDFAVVREALNRHIQDPEVGRFAPKPADLIRQIVSAKSSDGRPGRDEAWAIAQNAQDESKTVIVTEEILAALDVARPLLEMRDKVAARLAFVEAYDRLLAEKRAAAQPMEWIVSYGTDKHQRVAAIEKAVIRGQLEAPRAANLIAHEKQEPISNEGLAIAGLLTGTKAATPEELRDRWRDLRDQITRRQPRTYAQRRQEIQAAEQELQDFANGITPEDDSDE